MKKKKLNKLQALKIENKELRYEIENWKRRYDDLENRADKEIRIMKDNSDGQNRDYVLKQREYQSEIDYLRRLVELITVPKGNFEAMKAFHAKEDEARRRGY